MSAEKERSEPTTPQQARQQVERLVERFASNLDAYKRADYKEAHVRVEFIDPFFEALGWDVRNVRGYAEMAPHGRMVALVELMLDPHKKLAAASVPADKKLFERQIEATDREIDALVYELYGLTEEEIAIVEGESQ